MKREKDVWEQPTCFACLYPEFLRLKEFRSKVEKNVGCSQGFFFMVMIKRVERL
jgi:hypothetical protein